MLSRDGEANRRYDIFRSPEGEAENIGPFRRWARKTRLNLLLRPLIRPAIRVYERSRAMAPLRVVFFPALLTTPLVMTAGLKAYLRRKPAPRSELHEAALRNIESLVPQYPLHLYPIVCKALEQAYLQDEISPFVERGARVLEVAIGEGSFSKRIFADRTKVVGLDINPISLSKASGMPHLERAVICDCLDPPIQPGAFEVLLANNFLHHVSAKEAVLERWAKLTPKVVFNESTPYWASGWFVPYVLGKLGFRRRAAAFAKAINTEGAQDLQPKEALDEWVDKHYRIDRSVSYMSEDTFFLCAIFSFLMRCYGPPTPEILKRIFLGPLRWFALPLTRTLAELLIRFDVTQERSRDAYVSYTGTSRQKVPSRAAGDFVCPSCKTTLPPSEKCGGCGAQYLTRDRMFFLLDRGLKFIEENYDPAKFTLPQEHL